MGYISKGIADEIIAPDIISLSGSSNFLKLGAKKDGNKEHLFIVIKLRIVQSVYSEDEAAEECERLSNTYFKITEVNDPTRSYSFRGTKDPTKVDDKTFLVEDNNKSMVAESLKMCLLKSSFFRNKFSINIPFVYSERGVENGDIIYIQSLGAGDLYSFTFEEKDESGLIVNTINASFMSLDGNPSETFNADLIDHGLNNKDIEIDVYTDTGMFLGVEDRIQSTIFPGKLMTTLSKSYHGAPIWFDINALLGTNKVYSDRFLVSGLIDRGKLVTWVDAGTMTNARLVAKTYDGVRREAFYYSNVLYTITGYKRNLERIDMFEYVLKNDPTFTGKIKLLTNQPVLSHIKGQCQFLNFIFSDPSHQSSRGTESYKIGVFYVLQSPSGKHIANVRSLMMDKDLFGMVNTVRLDMDSVIGDAESEHGKKVGIAKVYLCDERSILSHPIEFRVMPDCLYRVNDFAFLNALGGWSSFSFGGEKVSSLKSDSNTVYKTLTPDFNVSSQIESVFDKEIKEAFSIRTLPVTAEVANWLKELSSSIAVYELLPDGMSRYVVVTDFDIKQSSKENLFVLEMKYHYSDTFNALIK